MGLLGFVLGGCMQSTLQPASDASLTPRDRQLLAHTPYAQATVPETYRRHIVDYTRKEMPGTILVDTDARYLYYVMPGGKAIRYGVAPLFLYKRKRDPLSRTPATTQPEYIGKAISSGCIRMTNEDVIDLFERGKPGATVVVLVPRHNAWHGS